VEIDGHIGRTSMQLLLLLLLLHGSSLGSSGSSGCGDFRRAP
jgi:hypothetical protein